MKITYLKLKSWLLTTLIGALGFAACKSSVPVVEQEQRETLVPPQEIRLMYGVPTINYQMRGQVRSTDGQPLGNIRINILERNIQTVADSVLGDPQRVHSYLSASEVRTDADGNFSIERSDRPQEQVRLLVRDVDGAEHGAFKNRLIEIPVTRDDVDTTGANGWFQGTFQRRLDISLEEK